MMIMMALQASAVCRLQLHADGDFKLMTTSTTLSCELQCIDCMMNDNTSILHKQCLVQMNIIMKVTITMYTSPYYS